MGWFSDAIRDIGESIQDGWNNLVDAYYDLTEEAYSWFGIEYHQGNVMFTSERPRQPRFAMWGDVMDPDASGDHAYVHQFYPDKRGYIVQLQAEFVGDGASSAAGGTLFVGHAPEAVFDSLVVTVHNTSLQDTFDGPGWSCRLVQRDAVNGPIFVSGQGDSISDDGVIFRNDVRVPAQSFRPSFTSLGGPITPGLPLFITCTPYGDLSTIPTVGAIRVQVTANILIEPAL